MRSPAEKLQPDLSKEEEMEFQPTIPQEDAREQQSELRDAAHEEENHPEANDDEDDESWLSDYTSADSICWDATEFEKSFNGVPTAPIGPLRAALRELPLLDLDFEDHRRQNQDGILELNILVDLIDRDEYVPPLQDTAREFVLFGARSLYSFFDANWYDLNVPASDGCQPAAYCDRDMFTLAYFKIAYWAQFNLKARWKRKLLRNGQVVLVETVMRRLMSELQLVSSDIHRRSKDGFSSERKMEPPASAGGSDKSHELQYTGEQKLGPSDWNELYKIRARSSIVVCSGLIDFLSSERFRSERLETLITKYLNDDATPDMHLVNGIRRLTMDRAIHQMPEYSSLLTGKSETNHSFLERPREWRPNEDVKPVVRRIFQSTAGWDLKAGVEAL